MKVQYKLALLAFTIGAIVLVSISVAFSIIEADADVESERANSIRLADELAKKLELLLEEKINTILTLSHAPVIREALLRSNARYSALAEEERQRGIAELNSRWMAAKDAADPFIRPYLENPVARYLAGQSDLIPGEYGEIFATNRFGALIATTGKLTTFAHSQKYWWIAAYHEGKGRPFVDDRGFDLSVEGYVVGVVVPVKQGNEVIGIVKANLKVGGVLGRATAGTGKDERWIRIVRSGGLVVFDHGVEPLSTRVPRDVVARMAGRGRGTLLVEEGGKEHLAAISPVSMTFGSEQVGFGGKYKSADQIKGNEGEGWNIVFSRPMADIRAISEETTRRVALMGGLVTLLLAVASMAAGRAISKPLISLSRRSQEIGKGQFEGVIEYSSNDEIGTLVDSFNTMAATLKATMISRDVLAEEVFARREAEKEVEKRAEELARSNAELEQFAYATSHDLQEPLRKMSNFAGLLVRRYRGRLDEKADEYLDYIEEGGDRMQTMIRDILEYSRVGQHEEKYGNVDLEEVVGRVRKNLYLVIEEQGARVTNGQLPRVWVNRARIEQLMQNLIENAIKFRGDAAPEVYISATRQEGQWEVTVTDNGIGIDPEQSERVFGIFQRLHSRTEYAGTGIGLSLCKKIVESHGGRIWVDSRPGEGAVFYFTLPFVDSTEG